MMLRFKWSVLATLALFGLCYAGLLTAQSLDMAAGPLVLSGYAFDDNDDHMPDPGEHISLTLTLTNQGEEPVYNVQAVLTASQWVSGSLLPPGGITLTRAVANYGDIVGGQSASNDVPFALLLSPNLPSSVISFTLYITASGSGPWSHTFTTPVGLSYAHFPIIQRNWVCQVTPNDPYFAYQWALPHIQAPQAWCIFDAQEQVVIAVVDTGADMDHPDLLNNLWRNPNEVAGNGLDDDGNGYVDDVHGYDFANNDPDPDDDHQWGHGTHVAGIVAATPDNYIGVAGLTWDGQIMPLKAAWASGYGTTNELIESIEYAVDNGARVISCSLGEQLSYCYRAVQRAIDYASDNGVLFVATAGDYGDDIPFYPAACNGVLAVSATTAGDERMESSNFGDYVDVSAPGAGIYSTLIGGYGYASGPSMATPFVSGLAAMLYSQYPDYDDELVAWMILQNADDLGALGWDQDFGWGRINAARALSRVASGAPDYAIDWVGVEALAGYMWPVGEALIPEIRPSPALRPGYRADEWVPGEILVGLQTPSLDLATLLKDVQGGRLYEGMQILERHAHLGVWRVAVLPGQENLVSLALQADPRVVFAERNAIIRVADQ